MDSKVIKCSAITRSGQRCRRPASLDNEFCFSHRPDTATMRRRNAAIGGHAKANRLSEIAGIRQELKDLARRVAKREVPTHIATTICTIANAYAKLYSEERKEREVTEILPRLEEIENRMRTEREDPHTRGGVRWGV